jgi:thioredoxin reductase (NADPH)
MPAPDAPPRAAGVGAERRQPAGVRPRDGAAADRSAARPTSPDLETARHDTAVADLAAEDRVVPADAEPYDVLVVGAGPIGLEAAIAARRAGLRTVVLEAGAIAHAIVRYPTYMTFFTTSERLEIGGHPLVSASDKPTRKEALDYYRRVSAAEGLDIRTYTRVTRLGLDGDAFELKAVQEGGAVPTFRARAVLLATGYFDDPNRLEVPGADLPHVTYRYTEGHIDAGREVVVVGGGSGAADAALDLHRHGARVTIVHRGADFKRSLKYWIRPNLENRVKEGSIRAVFGARVVEITPWYVVAQRLHPDGRSERLELPARRVILLLGYTADPALLVGAGAEVDPVSAVATVDPATRETTVPGLYAIGSAGMGGRTSDVFIENGLPHARQAVAHVAANLRGVARAG